MPGGGNHFIAVIACRKKRRIVTQTLGRHCDDGITIAVGLKLTIAWAAVIDAVAVVAALGRILNPVAARMPQV